MLYQKKIRYTETVTRVSRRDRQDDEDSSAMSTAMADLGFILVAALLSIVMGLATATKLSSVSDSEVNTAAGQANAISLNEDIPKTIYRLTIISPTLAQLNTEKIPLTEAIARLTQKQKDNPDFFVSLRCQDQAFFKDYIQTVNTLISANIKINLEAE